MNDKKILHLLRSSLPLEHEVAMIAHRSGYFNDGEFSYSRVNEHGRDTDFSVDLLVSCDVSAMAEEVEVDKYLNVLMECKYASPSVAWVFSTAPKHEPLIMTAFSAFPWFGTHLIHGYDRMKSLQPEVYCTRGVSLSSESADPKQVRHGLQQLRYAIPRLLESLCDFSRNSDGPVIPVIAPVLVTNAPLFVLRENVSVPSTEQAQSLQDVATEYAHLCVYQKAGPELRAFCRSSATVILNQLLPDNALCSVDMLTADLIDAVESITVVSAKHVPKYLADLKEVVSELAVVSREHVFKKISGIREA